MRFGLDGLPLSELRTGVGHYTFELARALAAIEPDTNFALISPRRYLSLHSDEVVTPNLQFVREQVGVISKRWWTIGLPRYIKRNSLALFHGTNYDVPLWNVCPTVLTVHDLSSFIHPETHVRRRVWRTRRRLPLMVRAATIIVTPTESVRREVREHLRVEPEKIIAVPEAPRQAFKQVPFAETREVRRRFRLENDFLLTVGTLEPRKNLQTLVGALEELISTTDLRPQLVIVGREGWLTDELHARINRSPARERIILTGYLDESELRALYSSCHVFIYPSIYEGFGLPLLEAMACNASVIASRIAAHSEVIGDDSALFFEPTDASALARSIYELLTNEAMRQRLAHTGRKRAGEFSWERTARRTLEVYTEACARFAAHQKSHT